MVEMTNEKYNGWANRETWLVNMYFGEALSEMIEEDVEAGYIEIEDKPDYEVKGIIAERISSFIDDHFEEEIEGLSTFLKDFIDLGRIDTYDLATSIYSELI
jgi:hypothetical protein